MPDKLQSALDRVAAATTELRAATDALLAEIPAAEIYGLRLTVDFERTLERVVAATASVYQLDPAQLMVVTRKQPGATARQMAMTIVAEITEASSKRIAPRFGLAHHGAVLWARRAIHDRIDTDRHVAAAYAAIMARFATGS